MKKKYLILDCFVDEPACLGVPPFVSPYPRYVYGALLSGGADRRDVQYSTITQIKKTDYLLDEKYEMVFLIGGASVPGRYLGSHIGTLAEINRIVSHNRKQLIAVGGHAAPIAETAENMIRVTGDIEAFAAGSLSGDADPCTRRSAHDIAVWAVQGAPLVNLHPWHPDLIAEIETYRGCPRTAHCSFCSEGLFPSVEFREPDDIIREVESLADAGISRFRLGRQADILQYKTSFSEIKNGFPRPDAAPLKYLFGSLMNMRSEGRISTLNIDNANPGTIVNFPAESEEIIDIISRSVTPGDTMALGIESFDPKVIAGNALKVSAAGAFTAVEMINAGGGLRENGIPKILPGVNLLHGLAGETGDTFRINYDSLKEILDRGLLIKRINIRQVQPYPGTVIGESPVKISTALRNRFLYYRDKIRSGIDNPMLRKIFPPGTVLRECFCLEKHEGYSYLKQISSYPITVITAEDIPLMTFADISVAGYRERSLRGIPVGVNLNFLCAKSLEMIDGISPGIASDIILGRPYRDRSSAEAMLKNVSPQLRKFLLASI